MSLPSPSKHDRVFICGGSAALPQIGRVVGGMNPDVGWAVMLAAGVMMYVGARAGDRRAVDRGVRRGRGGAAPPGRLSLRLRQTGTRR